MAKSTPSAERLNKIASRLSECSTYLEIGVQEGKTFEAVDVNFKWAVDPNPLFNVHAMPPGCRLSEIPSDQFFLELSESVRFDLVFIDGLHHWEQAYRDLVNSLAHGRPGMAVLIDDTVPVDEFSAERSQAEAITKRRQSGSPSRIWNGDVYKILCCLSDHHPELDWMTFDHLPQTLVVKRDWGSPTLVRAADIAYEGVGFHDFFGSERLPDLHNPGCEEEVLDWMSG